MYYNDSHHMVMSQMCTGAGDYFRTSKPHSEKMCIVFSNHAHSLTRTHNQTFYFVRCVQKLKFKRVNCFHRKSRKGLCIPLSNALTIIRFGSGFLVLKVENTDVFQYILNIFYLEIDSDKYLVIQ